MASGIKVSDLRLEDPSPVSLPFFSVHQVLILTRIRCCAIRGRRRDNWCCLSISLSFSRCVHYSLPDVSIRITLGCWDWLFLATAFTRNDDASQPSALSTIHSAGTAGIIRQTFYRVAFPSARRCHSYLISLHYSLTRASSLLLSISSFICSSIPTIYFRKRFGKRLMPCISMFSRFKADRSGGGAGCTGGGGSNGAGGGGGSSSPSQTLLEGNAITTFFEIGRQTATAGPGYLWKVHDAYRKSDGKVTLYNS